MVALATAMMACCRLIGTPIKANRQSRPSGRPATVVMPHYEFREARDAALLEAYLGLAKTPSSAKNRKPSASAKVVGSSSERMLSRFRDDAWKRSGWLADHLPDEAAKRFPSNPIDADGTYATATAWLCVVAYKNKRVAQETAPTRLSDLLNGEWMSKLVKAHPGHSGMILPATANLVNDSAGDSSNSLSARRTARAIGLRTSKKNYPSGSARHRRKRSTQVH